MSGDPTEAGFGFDEADAQRNIEAAEHRDRLRADVEPLTLEQRVTRLEHRQRELTWYVAQTRYAADCMFNYITNGMAPGVPWEDMSTKSPDDPDAEPAVPPSRAQRRQAARSMAKRMTNVEDQ